MSALSEHYAGKECPGDEAGEPISPPKRYDRVQDVPTGELATRFVQSLILAEGNIGLYQSLTEMLIRSLRGEPLKEATVRESGLAT